MDIFVEQIIKKQFDIRDILIITGIIVGSLVLVVLCLLFLPFALIPVLIGIIALAYYLITSRNIEFEYSVTNSDITIDKIINKSRRKRVISFDAHNIEKMGKSQPAANDNSARINASENPNADNTWYFTGVHSQKGKVYVLFTPNEKVLSSIKPFLSRQVAIDAFGRNWYRRNKQNKKINEKSALFKKGAW